MSIRLTFFFTALVLLAVAHQLGINFSIYWNYFWFDILMHILGGLCVALGVAILPFFRITLPQKLDTLAGYLLFVFVVGVVWEVFELFAEISVLLDEDLFHDTAMDFVMDLLGGGMGYFVIKKLSPIES